MNPQSASESIPAADRVPHRCLVKLRGVYDSLKRAERRAADSILAKPEEVADSGIVEFAKRAGCSEATVVRLAQRLGYEGFPELRSEFGHPELPAMSYRDIRIGDAPEAVVRKVFANSAQALSDTLEALDLDQYAAAVEALLGAGRLAFFGLGNAAVVAREAYHKFLRIGVPVFTAEDPDLQLIILNSQLRRGDLLVTISYSGESKPMLIAAQQARSLGIRVLAITNFPRSSLAEAADLVLLTAVFQEHVNGEIGSKRLAQLCVLESLYVNYLLHQSPEVRRGLVTSNAALSQNKHRHATRPISPPRKP
ncbi:MAG: MurR/RpiR family transcriptional regulator [Limisphaerales bacterium]